MERVYNFSAGPSMLPIEVLEQAQKDMLNFKGSGMSVMEMSHRSKWFDDIIKEAEADLRELMNIPENYKVMFLQGGGSTQFAMIPLNLMVKGSCDLVNTGQWSKKAMQEAKKFGKVNVVASSEDKVYNYIPALDKSKFNKDADYFYITYNNTIYGTRYTELPDTGNVPLVADLSSMIMSEEIDINKFGLAFAGAQKNIGPAGVTVVIMREDLIGKAKENCPTMLDYKVHCEANSLYNTPPCYAIYIAGLVFKWLKKMGGVKEMYKLNVEKAGILYDYLDNSMMFKGTVIPKDRSLMNVPFVTESEELNAKFIKEATSQGFVNLKGHRTVGGMRASIYNAMPIEGVKALVDFMKKLELENK